MKIITKKWLQEQGACDEAIDAWGKQKDHSVTATLKRLSKRKNTDWIDWLNMKIIFEKNSRFAFVKNIKVGTKMVTEEWDDTFASGMECLIGKKIKVEPKSESGWFKGEGWNWHKSWLRFPRKRS